MALRAFWPKVIGEESMKKVEEVLMHLMVIRAF